MNVLIADDEAIARQILREHLEDIPGVTIAGEAANGADALSLITSLRPDVVLLDLRMPGLDGLSVARSLLGQPLPVVIYCTAHHEHALEGFDTGAVDYLLKPVRRERLLTALEKAGRILAGLHPPAVAVQKIPAKLGDQTFLLDPAEVIAFQADAEVVYVVTVARRYFADDSLRVLEQRLPPGLFRRVHRKTLINPTHIRSIAPLSSNRWLLRMSNGMEVVVSKRLAARFEL